MKKSVVIVGAGYGGLATANLLAKAGYKVDVYEKHATPGGRAGLVKKDGFKFDTGPSWYLMPEVFDKYYSIFNLSAKKELEIIRLTPGYKVFFENQEPITIQGNVAKDKKTFEAIEPGAGERLEKYVQESAAIYKLALGNFLYTNFQKPTELLSPTIIKSGLKMLGYALNNIDRHVSKRFTDNRLKQILEYHTVFLGSSPFETPAIYTLMSNLDFAGGVYYPKRGIYSMVESLVDIGKGLGVNYHYNSDIKKIITKNGQAKGLLLTNGEKIAADIVISNADLHFTETKLLEAKDRSYPEKYWDKRQPGPSALLMSLGIKDKLPNLLHHNLYFTKDWQENFDSIYKNHKIPKSASVYICNPSKTDASVAPKGTENIFVLVPLPSGVDLNQKQTNSLVDRFIEQISVITQQPSLKNNIITKHIYTPNQFSQDYNSWLNGALGGQSHKLMQSAIFRTPNKSKKIKNLYYVGAGTTPGIGLPMCLISSQLVYKRIMGIKSGGPIKQIERPKS